MIHTTFFIVLTENDIQILKIVLAEHLLKLEESGLDLNENNCITKEEVVIHLKKIDQHAFAVILGEEKGKVLSVHRVN